MQLQTSRAILAVLFLSMGLLALGVFRAWVTRPPVIPIAATFVGHINADRYQEAYAMTSPAFQACVTEEQFEEFCKRRNLPRPGPELLEPDRQKYPYSWAEVPICDNRTLPFTVGVVRDDDGHWRVDFVILHELDSQLK